MMECGDDVLGRTGRDVVTGFVGVITGHVRYLTGCNQYLLNPPVDKDGHHKDSVWFDDARIEEVKGIRKIVLPVSTGNHGPGEPAPIK